jgi:hypothetical protein
MAIYAYTDRRFEGVNNRLDGMAKDIAAMPGAIGVHIGRLIHEMNMSIRLAVIERQSLNPVGQRRWNCNPFAISHIKNLFAKTKANRVVKPPRSLNLPPNR